MKSECPHMVGYKKCNSCGREGHYERDCPSNRSVVARNHPQSQQKKKGGRPQALGRVYVMIGAETVGSGNLIIGCCLIAGKSLCVLYDSRATHSFVLESCVQELGLPVCELQLILWYLLRHRVWSGHHLYVQDV